MENTEKKVKASVCKTVFAIAFLILNLGVFAIWCVTGASFKINDGVDMQTTKVDWDETKLYPRANKKNGDKKEYVNPIDRKINHIKTTISNVTEETSVYMPGVKVKKIWDKYIFGFEGNTSTHGTANDPEHSMDIFVDMGDNSWCYIEDKGVPVYERTQTIVDFSNQQKKLGRNFIFLETTERGAKLPEKYKQVFGDYFYQKFNDSMAFLRNNGVDCLSTTEIIDNSGIDRKDLYFKTDHHWLPQTGLWMTKELAIKLNNEYDYDIDISKLDIDNYNVTYCEYPMFGSVGIKNTEIYCEYDYLPVVIPKFDTDLTVSIPERGYTKTGRLEDTVFDYDILSAKDPYVNKYVAYAFSDRKLMTIKNNNLHNGKRLLVIKKSMANCMTPYMSNIAEYVDVIDLRHFKGSLQAFMKETNPDTIVVVYSASAFGSTDFTIDKLYNFMD